MKKTVLIVFVMLLLLSSCGIQGASSQPDSLSDTIHVVHQCQGFAQAVDSLVYKGLLNNECLKGTAYVIEAKTGRIVAQSVLVNKGNIVEVGLDIYRDVIERGLSHYATSGHLKKIQLRGIRNEVSVYCGIKVLKDDAFRMESCCFFPEEFTKYEIFVAFEKKDAPLEAGKVCIPVIDEIINEIVIRGMLSLIIKKEMAMDSDSGVLAYFHSLCRNGEAEIWTHGYNRDDSLNVWDAVALLHLYAEGELKNYPGKELKSALCNMALEQAYRECHGGDEYENGNPGEKFLCGLLEKAAYYAPALDDIADILLDDGKTGQLRFMDWTGVYPMYTFLIYKGADGRFTVKKD